MRRGMYRDDSGVIIFDRLRGHEFLPDEETLSVIPPLGATGMTDPDDRIVWLHFYVDALDWWVVELERDGTEAFAFTSFGDPATASWQLVDLAMLAVSRCGPHVVQRELFRSPTPARSDAHYVAVVKAQAGVGT